MALGLAPAEANAYLNSLCRAAAYTSPAGLWVKLHTGDPGVAATANVAGNTTRVQVTFGTNASGGIIANTVAVDWTSVSTAETYSRFSVWDASVAGNFKFSGTITANSVAVGDNFSIPIGNATATLNVAA